MGKARETDAAHSEDSGNLFVALLEAQQALRSVTKNAKANYGERAKYAYVSADEMVAECRTALHGAGLVFFRASWQVVYGDHPVVLSTYRLVHAASGESISMDAVPWFIVEGAGRPFDKAMASALTTSQSYALRDLLLVPREDEAEIDRRDDSQYKPKPRGVGIGIDGAQQLRATLRAHGLEESALREAMNGAGVEVSPDMANWRSDWMPRIANWIDRNKQAQSE